MTFGQVENAGHRISPEQLHSSSAWWLEKLTKRQVHGVFVLRCGSFLCTVHTWHRMQKAFTVAALASAYFFDDLRPSGPVLSFVIKEIFVPCGNAHKAGMINSHQTSMNMRTDVKSKTMWSKPKLVFFFKSKWLHHPIWFGLCVEISFGQLWMRQRSRWHGDTGQRDPRSVVAQLHSGVTVAMRPLCLTSFSG